MSVLVPAEELSESYDQYGCCSSTGIHASNQPRASIGPYNGGAVAVYYRETLKWIRIILTLGAALLISYLRHTTHACFTLWVNREVICKALHQTGRELRPTQPRYYTIKGAELDPTSVHELCTCCSSNGHQQSTAQPFLPQHT